MVEFMGVPLSIPSMSGWGAFVLLAWVVIRGYSTGRIRTDREVDDIRKDAAAKVAIFENIAAEWRRAAEKRDAQNDRLLELSETSAHVLTSLPATGGGEE